MAREMKKDPASITRAALDGARTSSIIQEGRRTGKSDEDIVLDVFHGSDGIAELAKNITVVNLIKDMGVVFGLYDEGNLTKNKAFLGYMLIMQHYSQEPEAVAFNDFYQAAKTVEDVWLYFLKCNQLRGDAVVKLPGYDHAYFRNLLQSPIEENPHFALKSL